MKKYLLFFVVLMCLASVIYAGGQEDAAAQEDVTLTLWHWKVAFDPGFKAVADAFEEKTGIRVVTEITTPDEAYKQKLVAAGIAGNLPDLYAYWADAGNGSFDGVAMEWAGTLDADPAWRDSFFPAAISAVTISDAKIESWLDDENSSKWLTTREAGQVYGIPIDVGAFYTIYGNAELMKNAGISTDNPPATMEVWIEDMKKIQSLTETPGFVFSGQAFSLYENWFANFVDYMKNGPEEYTRFMTRESKMSDPEHMHVAQFLEDLAVSGNILAGSATLGIDEADQAFVNGQASYLLGGTFTFASLQAMGMSIDQIVSFRIPAYEGSKVPDATVSPFPLVMLNVNTNGKSVDKAIEFVKFMTSDEGMTLYANNAFDIPAISIKDTSKLNSL